MGNNLISIIVPVYKVEKYLQRCLDSLLCQDYSNIEIVLIDDGSPDNSGEICDGYKLKDDRIQVIHQSNAGLSAARNKGVDFAHGEWIMFVDSDDFVDCNYCSLALNKAINTNSDIVSFGYKDIIGQAVKKNEIAEEEEQKLSVEEALIELQGGSILSFVWNKIYRKTLFTTVKFPEGKVYEDIGTTYLLFDKANAIYNASGATYNYCKRPDSICSSISVENRIVWNELLLQRYDFMVEKYPRVASNPNVIKDIVRYILINLKDMYDVRGYKDEKKAVEDFLLSHKQIIKKSGFNDFMLNVMYVSPLAFRCIRIAKRLLLNK